MRWLLVRASSCSKFAPSPISPTDPEVFLYVLYGGTDPVGGGDKQATLVVFAGSNDFLISEVHAAGAFRRPFFPADLGEKDRLEGSISLRKSCIQTGKVGSPCFKSLRSATPFLESNKRASIRRLMRWYSSGVSSFGFSQCRAWIMRMAGRPAQ